VHDPQVLRELLLLLSPLPLFLPFLLSSPKGDLLLSLFLFEEPQQNGCPIHRAPLRWVGCKPSPIRQSRRLSLSFFACHSERSLSAAKNPRILPLLSLSPLGLELGFSPASMPAAKRPTALPKAGAKPEGRSDLLLPLLLPLFYFFAFLAQKSHVKPRNHLNQTNKTRWSWHVSYVQSAILKTVEKTRSPAGR